MDQTLANNLFEAGAIFLLLDMPQYTQFGIDYNCWRTGPNFKGVKMIPPGMHFIYYNVADKHGNLGLRNGFFHNFKQGEILAKKWNIQNEAIDTDYKFDAAELERFESNKQELDRFLGAYPYDEYKRWVSLSNNLTESFIEKLLPESKIISSGSILVGEEFKSSRSDKAEGKKETVNERARTPENLSEAEKRLPSMSHEAGTEIRFTQIPKDYIPIDSKPGEVTLHSIDKSHRFIKLIELQQALTQSSSPDEFNILCELQFAFICFLIGQCYDAFEQWKSLISLLCNCDRAIGDHLEFFIEFINTLYFQLKEMPADFFVDIISKDNFLTVNLHNLFDNINGISGVDKNTDLARKLEDKCVKFKNYLTQRFEIDFEEEPDEYAPVICEE